MLEKWGDCVFLFEIKNLPQLPVVRKIYKAFILRFRYIKYIMFKFVGWRYVLLFLVHFQFMSCLPCNLYWECKIFYFIVIPIPYVCSQFFIVITLNLQLPFIHKQLFLYELWMLQSEKNCCFTLKNLYMYIQKFALYMHFQLQSCE